MLGVNGFYDDYEEPLRNLYIGGLRGGANYIGAAGRVDASSPRFATAARDANAIFQVDKQPTKSFAIFTDNEFNLFGKLSLVAGLRYTYEKRDFEGAGYVVFNDGSLELANQFNLGPAIGKNSITTKRPSGRIGLNWRPTSKILGYITFSESFKSGGFDGAVLSNVSFFNTPYRAEVVKSLEVGFKSDPLPNLRVNGAVFYTDFQDPQSRVTAFAPGPFGLVPQGILANLDSARIYGAEGEVLWRPVKGLTLSATATLLDTVVRASGINIVFDDKPLTFAPKASATLSVNYEHPIGDKLVGRLQSNLRYASRHAVRPQALPIDMVTYTLVDAQVAVATVDDIWEVALSGRNLTNERYPTAGIQGFNAIAYNIGLPITWAISVRRRF